MSKQNFPGEYEIIPNESSIVGDIFLNRFDTTWHHRRKRDNPEQRVWSLIEGEQAEDDGLVSYVYNDEYFRSDNFTNVHNSRHILFAGCSETEGQGGNLGDAWGKILLDKINQSQKTSGYYSIAKAGYGWQKVIAQLRVYIDRYGKPDNLFIILPNMGRSIEWSKEQSNWYARQEHPNFYSDNKMEFEENIYAGKLSPEKYKKIFLDFVISWRLFEDFCNASGIKLLWGTWSEIDNYNVGKLRLFKNFVSLNQEDLLQNIDRYRKDAKLIDGDIKKRDGHHGRLFHEYWADLILQEATDRGFLND